MMIVAIAVAVLLALWLILKLTEPRCPHCGERMWRRYPLIFEWECGWCFWWYNPITKWSHK